MLGRAIAAAIYVGATLLWVGAMGLGSLLGCEGGCFGDERTRLETGLILSLVGLPLCTAAFFVSLANRHLGMILLAAHVVVFCVNLRVLSGLHGTASPWVLLFPGALAALAGYVAVGGASTRRAVRPQ